MIEGRRDGHRWVQGQEKVFGEGYVSLLIVEVDQMWSPACEAPAPIAAGTTAEALANQFAAGRLHHPRGPWPGQCLRPDGIPPGGRCPRRVHWYRQRSVWEGARRSGASTTTPEGQVVEYWFLDVEGTPVMVEASWVPGSSSEEDVAELQDSSRHPGDHSVVGTFSHRPQAALVESSAGRWCPGSRTPRSSGPPRPGRIDPGCTRAGRWRSTPGRSAPGAGRGARCLVGADVEVESLAVDPLQPA